MMSVLEILVSGSSYSSNNLLKNPGFFGIWIEKTQSRGFRIFRDFAFWGFLREKNSESLYGGIVD